MTLIRDKIHLQIVPKCSKFTTMIEKFLILLPNIFFSHKNKIKLGKSNK